MEFIIKYKEKDQYLKYKKLIKKLNNCNLELNELKGDKSEFTKLKNGYFIYSKNRSLSLIKDVAFYRYILTYSINELEKRLDNEGHLWIKFKLVGKDYSNFQNISSITKEEIRAFLNYLCKKDKKDVIIDKFICGGMFIPKPRDLPEIANSCLECMEEFKSHYQKYHYGYGLDDKMQLFCIKIKISPIQEKLGLIFNEDIYEYLVLNKIKKKRALKITLSRGKMKNHKGKNMLLYEIPPSKKYYISTKNLPKEYLYCLSEHGFPKYGHLSGSRYAFAYLFRSEYKKFMNELGFYVRVKGGWLRFNKKKEMKQGVYSE